MVKMTGKASCTVEMTRLRRVWMAFFTNIPQKRDRLRSAPDRRRKLLSRASATVKKKNVSKTREEMKNKAKKAKQKQQNPHTPKDWHINIYSQTYTKIVKRNKKEWSDYFQHSEI